MAAASARPRARGAGLLLLWAGLLGPGLGPVRCAGQVTWGPGPLHISHKDDLQNQQRLYDLLHRAYFADYGVPGKGLHALLPKIREEIDDFRQKVPAQPSLALAVGMARYHFAWYMAGTAEIDVESVGDAAELMYASIVFSGCNRPDLTREDFVGRVCGARWLYTVLLFSELGREFAARYLTDQAAAVLEKAIAVFDEMKRLPHFSPLSHWQNPYDVNFNEEWFRGVVPSGPIWDKAVVPLARDLEAGFKDLAVELQSVVDQGQFESLHFAGLRAEGQDVAKPEDWRAVEFTRVNAATDSDLWDTAACRAAPKTCAFLSGRAELRGCQHRGASLVRLRPGGRLKPRFGAAPQLQLHIALRADPGARMSVGNQTVVWKTGEAIVFDDTFIRQEWHNGVRGDRYVLQVMFCHPCSDSQRSLYSGGVRCPSQEAPLSPSTAPAARRPGPGQQVVSIPFAAAALWAVTLPELAKCNAGISELCPPDTQHGGANPLSAMNTWNYAMNNLKAALRYAGTDVDPAVLSAIAQVQAGIQGFLKVPALDSFGAIVTLAMQIFEALLPWLQQQGPAQVRLPTSPEAPAAVGVPSDGKVSLEGVAFRLANGIAMPAVGFGTWKLEGQACYDAVRMALELGIRHIDTAEAYGNEADIGRALRDSGVPRGELFIATKATSVAMGMAQPAYLESIFAGQLQALQVEYVDVYMLHAGGVKGETLREVWQGMERLVDMGRVRSLGVSNFGVEELEALWEIARIKPVYLQNIFKVYKQGEQILGSGKVGVLEWARSHAMVMVGYSGINSWPHMLPPLQDPHVLAIAKAKGRTASQVLHRWALQQGVAVIPKASLRDRIRENLQLLDFELAPAEMALLGGLATLSESTHDQVRPAWLPDVYELAAAR